MRIPLLFCVASVSLALIGCSAGQNVDLAEAQIPVFRKAVESDQLDTIYEQSSEELKSSASKADLVNFLSGVRDKLGPVSSSTQKTWNVNYRMSATFVTLVYETKFSAERQRRSSSIESRVKRFGSPDIISTIFM